MTRSATSPTGTSSACWSIARASWTVPDFGLRVGRAQDLQVLGPVAIVMRHSATVAEAITSVARYLSFHTPGAAVALIDAPEEAPGFTVEIVLPELRRARQINELGMFLGQRMLELLLGEGYRALAVHFASEPPDDVAPLRRVFGARLEFGMPMGRFALREAELGRPVRNADATVRRLIASHIDLARRDPGVPLVDRVSRAVRTLLPSGRCSLPAVSDQLGFAPRSLQRALHQRGACFRELQEAQQRHAGGAVAEGSAPAAAAGRLPGRLRRPEHLQSRLRALDREISRTLAKRSCALGVAPATRSGKACSGPSNEKRTLHANAPTELKL
jgi:hypothetical protein